MSAPTTIDHFYPEAGASGFTRTHGVVAFYTRVQSLVEPDMNVLSYGVGGSGWSWVRNGISRTLAFSPDRSAYQP